MIKFVKIIEKNDLRMAMFVKPNKNAVFGDECLYGMRFIQDGVSLKKAQERCESKKDWSNEIDIIEHTLDDGRVVGKVVRV